MPTYPIGSVNRKGELGSYYSVKDYLGVNPEFGTAADLKSVIDKAHELGMHVLLESRRLAARPGRCAKAHSRPRAAPSGRGVLLTRRSE